MSIDQIGSRPAQVTSLPNGAEFALCLTHDVDRPYKGFRSLYYATQERPGYHLRTALDRSNPYWQFAEIMELEDDLGVRSAFYFLNEQHLFRDRPPREWLSPEHWVQHLGRYEVDSDDIATAIRDLSTGGWEVGLHGSYHTQHDRDRLRTEKVALENVLGEQLSGGRQHHLRLSVPETWEHYREIGLSYDTSLGSTTDCGFHDGYHPIRPFGDEFVVFPLTIMDQALPDPATSPDAARRTCERLLIDAARNDAVMTVLWHPRFFNEREFPGHRALYRWLVERALELGAWVGSPGTLYETIDAETVEQQSVSIGTDSERELVSTTAQTGTEESRRGRGNRREEAAPQLRSASSSGGDSSL